MMTRAYLPRIKAYLMQLAKLRYSATIEDMLHYYAVMLTFAPS